MDWKNLLNGTRRKPKDAAIGRTKPSSPSSEFRTEFERDYDRILFSTPVRRLSNKTQVFPLERNASIRTRLTHSHEASNLARSIGVNLAFNHRDVFSDDKLIIERNVPAILAAVGLAHDLGNPPFGHQGESAIQQWFHIKSKKLFENHSELTEAMRQDFLRFEGNAQTLRLLTRLQLINDDYGLNLTRGTLASLMKYTVPSDKVDGRHVATKKHGYFQSEREIVEDIWAQTGLSEGKRHPLTYVMEACDDIAYSVLDAEDAVKKKLASFSDVIAFLQHDDGSTKDPVIEQVCQASLRQHEKFRGESLSPSELNDISMQMFRVYSIGAMISAVTKAFVENKEDLLAGRFPQDLITVSAAESLCIKLKSFDKLHAYKHRSVLEVELTGYKTIHGLMDFLWDAIVDRKNQLDPASARRTPFSAYVYQRISENYRRIFEDKNNIMPIRYREMQLLTDMISGMTDTFAGDMYQELKQYAI